MSNFLDYLPHAAIIAVAEVLVVVVVIIWVLMTKKDSTAAVAWCLVVLLMPFLGALLFWVFGYTHVSRPLRRKRRHAASYRRQHPPRTQQATRSGEEEAEADAPVDQLGRLARRVRAFPVSEGNAVTLYHDTNRAFDNLLSAVREAQHHIHLEFYIFRADGTGERLIGQLTEKAKAGVEVRLLFDAMGCVRTSHRLFRPLLEAGGKVSAFLPLNPLRSRIQVNLRNHRKITVIDGRVGFTGGMNIGDEYLGLNHYFGYWRDQLLRMEGPAVAGLQRVFAEDWDFARQEPLDGEAYFPNWPSAGDAAVQVVESGPDQEINSIREIFFGAILSARERVWIASPYFVPDAGLLDALRLARYRGIDVRILSLLKPDHFLPFYAAHFYWPDMLKAGVKVYQYSKGMMHAKLMMVDGKWAFVGSANFDNRSLHLNFEVGCMLHTPGLVAELEEQYRRDLQDAVPLEAHTYARRPFPQRVTENACRLFSPLL
jgi:cardiolipin synthase